MTHALNSFLWIPGEGIDEAALHRLRSHFHRPSEPMGEAWFMGEHRRMFDELLGDIGALSTHELKHVLDEISSGTGSFGPQAEWHDWYHHLLGVLLPRSHEAFVGSLLESLITAFIALYPNGLYRAPYPAFRDDVLLTLGRCMMDRDCWNGSDITIGKILRRSNNNPNRIWLWWDASGDLSSSMFFCLKYLPEPCIGDWLRSVLAIPSPHWRTQIIVWMVGAHDLLNDRIHWPSEFPENAYPAVHWEWSHCLRPALADNDESGAAPMASLLPPGNRLRALQVFDEHFTDDVFLEWLESIRQVPYLESELAEIPSAFEALYLRRPRT